MDVFPHVKPPEHFLDVDGLPGKVGEVLFVLVLQSPYFEHFAGIKSPEKGFYPDGSCLFSEELLPEAVHPENGLNFEGSGVVSFPVFLCLVGGGVVVLGEAGPEELLVC